MDAKQIITNILKNPAFYAALLALVHAVILYFWPDFPVSIMAAGDAFIAVIASAITGQMVVAEQQQRRAIANERGITAGFSADGERGGG